MSETFPRVTLFAPCTAESLTALAAPLGRAGLEVEGGLLRGDGLASTIEAEWVENDGGFGAAFSFGTVPTDKVAALDRAPGALLLHCHADLRDGREQICEAVRRLWRAGALAVRREH